jgi:S1-C subfamily serine protease
MIVRLLTLSVVGLFMSPVALADRLLDFSAKMEINKELLASGAETVFSEDGFANDLPTGTLSDIVQRPSKESLATGRSAKDTQIYKLVAPSVVLIVTKEGLGSGSLLSSAGDILTNYHVVKGYSTVAVIFKPEKRASPLAETMSNLARS